MIGLYPCLLEFDAAASGSPLWELFRHPETAAIFGFFGMIVLVVAISVTAQVVRFKAEAELKQSMVERGMTPEEIERVLKARSH